MFKWLRKFSCYINASMIVCSKHNYNIRQYSHSLDRFYIVCDDLD